MPKLAPQEMGAEGLSQSSPSETATPRIAGGDTRSLVSPPPGEVGSQKAFGTCFVRARLSAAGPGLHCREVGMSGSPTVYSSFKAGMILVLSLTMLSFTLGDAASAHGVSSWRKQRHHVEGRARKQLGAPYSYGGTSPRGFDCSGFTRWVYSGHGASLPHSSSAQFSLGRYGKNKRVWKRSKLEVGDLVFHNTSGSGVSHAGIYIGRGKFISSTSSSGVRVSSLYDSYWGPRWVGATRLPVTMRYKP